MLAKKICLISADSNSSLQIWRAGAVGESMKQGVDFYSQTFLNEFAVEQFTAGTARVV